MQVGSPLYSSPPNQCPVPFQIDALVLWQPAPLRSPGAVAAGYSLALVGRRADDDHSGRRMHSIPYNDGKLALGT